MEVLSFAETRQHLLSVAHATEDRVDLISPVQVSQDHVGVDVSGFSCFGLVTSRRNLGAIRGLVLLFSDQSESSLFVLLLPRNVCLTQVDISGPSPRRTPCNERVEAVHHGHVTNR